MTRFWQVTEQKLRLPFFEASTWTRSHSGAAQTPRRPARSLLVLGHGTRTFWFAAAAVMVVTGAVHLPVAREVDG